MSIFQYYSNNGNAMFVICLYLRAFRKYSATPSKKDHNEIKFLLWSFLFGVFKISDFGHGVNLKPIACLQLSHYRGSRGKVDAYNIINIITTNQNSKHQKP